jgi:hypothetical protein
MSGKHLHHCISLSERGLPCPEPGCPEGTTAFQYVTVDVVSDHRTLWTRFLLTHKQTGETMYDWGAVGAPHWWDTEEA